MWIQRDVSGVPSKAFAQFPVVVLTGARQSGKTSLVRKLFPDAGLLNYLLGFPNWKAGMQNAACGPKCVEKAAIVCRPSESYPLAEKGHITTLSIGGQRGLHDWLADA